MKKRRLLNASVLSLFILSLLLCYIPDFSYAGPQTLIKIDGASDVHDINPLIYGLAFADGNTLKELNIPINRSGGNSQTRYNWKADSTNRAQDWYFESLPIGDKNPNLPNGSSTDVFYETNKANGAETMLTIPMLGYVAKDGERRCSFSVAKYGAQQDTDSQWFPDAGNGIKTDGTKITGNDPLDAHIKVDENFTKDWINHLKGRYGDAGKGGVKYYLLDNEPGLWTSTHWDVAKTALHDDEFINLSIKYANMIKNTDPTALTVGYEDWGWSSLVYSPYDFKLMNDTENYSKHPDKEKNGYNYFAEYYLKRMKEAEKTYGKRLLDVFTTHYYPQGGEYSGSETADMQARRLRSTRGLWDPNYLEENWQNEKLFLIPRIKQWVNANYPGTKTGITEYNWGSLDYPDGGIAQADILGIFGREGLDIGTLWTTVNKGTPGYNAFKIFRNYDGKNSTFGDKSIKCTVPNPDQVSSFASIDSKTGDMKIMVLSKLPSGDTPVTLDISNFSSNGSAKIYQWAGKGSLSQQPSLYFTGSKINLNIPAYSATLLVVGKNGTATPVPSNTMTPTPTNKPTPTGVTGNIKVQFYNSKLDSNIQINPEFNVINTGKEAIKLKDVTLRYYYTLDGGTEDQSFDCWSEIGSANITHKFVPMQKTYTGADHYLEVGFTEGAGTLAPGASLIIYSWFNKSDWSGLNQLNDYSVNPEASDFVDWTRVIAYKNGIIQWGTEPGKETPSTITPTTSKPTPTPTVTLHKISGYIAPDFQFEDSAAKEVKQGFKVELEDSSYSAVTDGNGYFEIKGIPPNKRLYRLKISKTNYLTRYIDSVGVVQDLSLGTNDLPTELWAGDIAVEGKSDEAIGMPDIMALAKSFNAAPGEAKYDRSLDFNLDNSINMKDILIITRHFSKVPKDYPQALIK